MYVFNYAEPNASVLLENCNVEIEIDSMNYQGIAEIRLDLVPKALIKIYATINTVPLNICLRCMSGQSVISKLKLENKEIEADFGGVGTEDNNRVFVLFPQQPLTIIDDLEKELKSLKFVLYNFRGLFGSHIITEEDQGKINSFETIDLDDNNWSIKLSTYSETTECIRYLRLKGGYGPTHWGTIKKKNNSIFSCAEATNIISALDTFFSFAKGTRCNPVCVVGYDGSEKYVWAYFASPRAQWTNPLSWLDDLKSSQLSELFTGFMQAWNTDCWQKAMQKAIFNYCSANNSSHELSTGIILTQAAIEMLSFVYSVKYKKLISSQGYNKLRASDKFRILFSSIDIPIEIPNLLGNIINTEWHDAPCVLTEIRNSVVHPDNKYEGLSIDLKFEVWNLGLWYLELALLGICGFRGSYSNRLDLPHMLGKVERVPWS